MIALIVAATRAPAMYGLDEHLPMALFPLGDRPILHHIVDCLAAQGVRRFEFLMGHLPEKIESYLVDGARWGCSFQFHLMPSESNPLHLAETIASGLDEEVLLGRGDRLPQIPTLSADVPTVFLTASREWTGWAVLPKNLRSLADLDHFASGKSASATGFREVVVEREVAFDTPLRLLQGQHDLLSGEFSASALGLRPAKPGIWISRKVSLHPSVQLEPPVYIGPNCRIREGAQIGPSAVIGAGSIVDEQSMVAHTLVAPGTYIGQGLELEHVIVNRNLLVNAKIDTAFLVSEKFLLSGLDRQKKPPLIQRLISTFAALALLVLPAPFALATLFFLWLGRKGTFVRERAITIPALDDPRVWHVSRYLRFRLADQAKAGWWIDFAAEVWPGLLAVLAGSLFLVGVKPRSPEEVQSLPSDWKALYLNSKAGLITEASVMFGKTPSEDELYTAEAYYGATQRFRHDLKLLRLYLRRLLSFGRRDGLDFADDAALGGSPEFPSGEPL
jgi:NDP-sugar pyrophosphorylase family protein